MKNLNIPNSPIGYGCYGLSGAYGAKLKEEENISLIQTAFELGVRIFDTAGAYTGTEEILGKAVRPFRNKISIATKISLREDKRADLSKKSVILSCEKSLRKLNTDYIDLFQVHFDDPLTSVDETIDALETLKEKGKIRYFGIGHLPINRILEFLQKGDCSTVLAEMNPISMNRYNEIHPFQEHYQFHIIAFSVTARGLLTGKINESTKFSENDLRRIDPQFKRSKLKSGLRIVQKFKSVGMKYGKSSGQMALAWVLQNKGVGCALTGPTNIKHLHENLSIMDWRIPEGDFNDLHDFVQEETEELNNIILGEIHEILFLPLSNNHDKAIGDLIYVLENLIEGKLLSTEKGYPIFIELLQQENSEKSLKKIEQLKQEIILNSDFQK